MGVQSSASNLITNPTPPPEQRHSQGQDQRQPGTGAGNGGNTHTSGGGNAGSNGANGAQQPAGFTPSKKEEPVPAGQVINTQLANNPQNKEMKANLEEKAQSKDGFAQFVAQSFGVRDAEKVESLRQDIVNDNWDWAPQVQMGQAEGFNGAFVPSADGQDGGQILLDDSLHGEPLAKTMWEEMGHAMDHRLRGGEGDAKGDEGHIFAATLAGEAAPQSAYMENDRGAVHMNGRTMNAEFAPTNPSASTSKPSASTSKPSPLQPMMLSGHGGWTPNDGTFTVPQGVEIVTYAPHGATISDRLGQAIESGSTLRGGAAQNVPRKTYKAGDVIPNYRLSMPNGLNIVNAPQGTDQLRVSGPPTKSQSLPSVTLRDLHQNNQLHGSVHWAACVEATVDLQGNPALGYNRMADIDKHGNGLLRSDFQRSEVYKPIEEAPSKPLASANGDSAPSQEAQSNKALTPAEETKLQNDIAKKVQIDGKVLRKEIYQMASGGIAAGATQEQLDKVIKHHIGSKIGASVNQATAAYEADLSKLAQTGDVNATRSLKYINSFKRATAAGASEIVPGLAGEAIGLGASVIADLARGDGKFTETKGAIPGAAGGLIGGVVGTAMGGPVGGVIGGVIGGLVGDAAAGEGLFKNYYNNAPVSAVMQPDVQFVGASTNGRAVGTPLDPNETNPTVLEGYPAILMGVTEGGRLAPIGSPEGAKTIENMSYYMARMNLPTYWERHLGGMSVDQREAFINTELTYLEGAAAYYDGAVREGADGKNGAEMHTHYTNNILNGGTEENNRARADRLAEFMYARSGGNMSHWLSIDKDDRKIASPIRALVQWSTENLEGTSGQGNVGYSYLHSGGKGFVRDGDKDPATVLKNWYGPYLGHKTNPHPVAAEMFLEKAVLDLVAANKDFKRDPDDESPPDARDVVYQWGQDRKGVWDNAAQSAGITAVEPAPKELVDDTPSDGPLFGS